MGKLREVRYRKTINRAVMFVACLQRGKTEMKETSRQYVVGVALGVISLVLVGCSSTPKIKIDDANAISDNMRVKRDDFKKTAYYFAPSFSQTNRANEGVDDIQLDATVMEKDNTVVYGIYIKDNYTRAWRHYDTAYDSEGVKFKTISAGKDVGCGQFCIYYENFTIPVTRDYLKKYATTGVKMKISGRGPGEEVFSIPSGYIQGFLKGTAFLETKREVDMQKGL